MFLDAYEFGPTEEPYDFFRPPAPTPVGNFPDHVNDPAPRPRLGFGSFLQAGLRRSPAVRRMNDAGDVMNRLGSMVGGKGGSILGKMGGFLQGPMAALNMPGRGPGMINSATRALGGIPKL